jgi:hypothetical protein
VLKKYEEGGGWMTMRKHNVKIAFLCSLLILVMGTIAESASPPPLTSISIFVYRTSIAPGKKIMVQVTETGVTTSRTVKVGSTTIYPQTTEPLPSASANPITGYRLTYDTGYTTTSNAGQVITVTAQGWNSQTSTTINASKTYTIPY